MKFFSNIKDKIAVSLIAILSVICIFLYVGSLNQSHTIDKQEIELSALSEQLKEERIRVKNLVALAQEYDEIVTSQKEDTKSLQKATQDVIQGLNKNRGKLNEEGKNSGSVPLDDNVIGMLSDLCERVRGSPCPNP